MNKIIRFISVAACALLLIAVFSGCGSTDDKPPTPSVSGKTFVIEAESMNLSEYYGVGYSGGGAQEKAIQSGANMPKVAADSLNKKDVDGRDFNSGYFVGFFNGEGTKFIFTFESDAAEEDCTLKLRLGSEHGEMMFNPDLLTIKVNGSELTYDKFTVKGGADADYGEFGDYEISAKIDLVDNELLGNDDIEIDGEVVLERPIRRKNTVELILKANNYWTTGTNPTGGPGIDCIKIVTDEDANLTWDDYWNGGFAVDVEEFEGEVNVLYQSGYKDLFAS